MRSPLNDHFSMVGAMSKGAKLAPSHTGAEELNQRKRTLSRRADGIRRCRSLLRKWAHKPPCRPKGGMGIRGTRWTSQGTPFVWWWTSFRPNRKWMAKHVFRDIFPLQDSGSDGFHRAGRPAGANMHPMDTGSTTWRECLAVDFGLVPAPDYYARLAAVGGRCAQTRRDRRLPLIRPETDRRRKKSAPRRVRFLCTDQYCSRYMVGTPQGKGEV